MTDHPSSCLRMKILAPLVGLGLLSSCSAYNPDYIACPSVSALQGYENVMLTGADHGQKVTMRLNGVGTRCYAIDSGYRMEVELGLLIKRIDANMRVNERVPVSASLVYLDADDAVVGRDVFEEEAFIGSFRDKSRPVFPFSVDVPQGTRVVLGLGQAVE